MNKIATFRWLTLGSYFGLMLLIFCWLLWIQPPEPQFISIMLLIYIGPLMLPLRGILHGKAYTHAWAAYMALFYFIVGIWNASVETTRIFGILISILSIIFFTGCVFYARFSGKQAKQSQETGKTA